MGSIDAKKIEKYIEQYQMSLEGCNNVKNCNICGISRLCELYDLNDNYLEKLFKEIEYLEEWVKEHPFTSYQEIFLKTFPKALLLGDIPKACRKDIFGEDIDCYGRKCEDCWKAEYSNRKRIEEIKEMMEG